MRISCFMNWSWRWFFPCGQIYHRFADRTRAFDQTTTFDHDEQENTPLFKHPTKQGFYDLGMPSAIDADPSSVQTNIVLVTVGPDLSDEGVTAAVVCERLKDKGVLAMAIMKGVIRFVTHSQVTIGAGGLRGVIFGWREVPIVCDKFLLGVSERCMQQ